MDEKKESEQVDEETREREASELQAQIDELISGEGDTEVDKPKTLRELAEYGRRHSKSEKSVHNDESDVKNDEGG